MNRRPTNIPAMAAPTVAVFLAICSQTSPAWAAQEHGVAEGMVVHQLGHVLFVIGMFYPLYRINLQKPQEPGWGCFKAFLWTIILWNVIAFVSHWLGAKISPEQYLTERGTITGLRIDSAADAIFYLCMLEHLVLAPSLLFLLLALRQWNRRT
jgi:hypothetical protein